MLFINQKKEDAMNMFKRLFCMCVLLTGLLGCATQVQNMPQSTTNPPPVVKFSDYRSFQMLPVRLNPEYADSNPNQRAFIKIQENLTIHTSKMLADWNAAPRATTRGTLVIQPDIVEIKFVSGGARVWAGAMAGSSVVVMKVYFRDKETGQPIAQPDFYQRAAAMGGSASFGGTDNAMLERITVLVADYIQNNFSAAMGGRTGATVD